MSILCRSIIRAEHARKSTSHPTEDCLVPGISNAECQELQPQTTVDASLVTARAVENNRATFFVDDAVAAL